MQDIVLSTPESEEFVSHGAPTFRIRGKIFGTYTINHHGDGRVALNLIAPKGMQAFYTEMEPEFYFVPAYTGPKGWLGILLDQGLDWSRVVEHVYEAYAMVAPSDLVDQLDQGFRAKPPTRKFRPEEIDPFVGKRAKTVLKRLRTTCERLPETTTAAQFGCPVWKAGKKTFVSTDYHTGRLQLSFWVGMDRQKKLAKDRRFSVSPYTGHNGWINLDVEDEADWQEIDELIMDSYRHFALKRMLRQLDE